MKVLLVVGDQPRHRAFASAIHASFPLSGILLQRREEMIPQAPDTAVEHDKQLFNRHFAARAEAESRHMGDPVLPEVSTLETDADTLNSERSARFVRQVAPEVALVFGTGLIREPLLSALPHETLNLHLGLSPRYRGAATLFWPFYFLEPAFAGSTFHYLTEQPDAGMIVHQCMPVLHIDDRIHDVACKTVLASCRDAVGLLQVASQSKWQGYSQKTTGKLFLERDFQPAHLRLIYDVYDDNIVREYLEGHLEPRKPTLRRQFEGVPDAVRLSTAAR